jgi:hypothetical protein
MSEILVSFEDKKETIANWVSTLSEIPVDNIGGVEEWGKLPYPAAYLSRISERAIHRPVKVSEEIDGNLKSVVYSSKQVRVDVMFVTRDRGDYSDVDPVDYVDAEHYANNFDARLYNDEESIETLSGDGLSLQLNGPTRKRDEQYEDGWLRVQIIEVALGYVQQTSEDQYQVDLIDNMKATVHFSCPDNVDPDCSPVEVKISVTYVTSVDEKTGAVDLSADYAALDSEGKILEGQGLFPDIFSAADETEQLALEVKKGDLCLRLDEHKTYISLTGENTSMSDWVELLFSGGPNGYTISIEKTITGSSLESDANRFIRFNNGAVDIEYVIENDGDGDFTHPVDTEMPLYREGTGEVEVDKGTLVVFEGPVGDNPFKLSGTKNSLAFIKKLGPNRWAYFGGVKIA